MNDYVILLVSPKPLVIVKKGILIERWVVMKLNHCVSKTGQQEQLLPLSGLSWQ